MIAHLKEILSEYTVDELKVLFKILPDVSVKPKKKAEFVNAVYDGITRNLKVLWDKCSDIEKKAIQETVYSDSLNYDPVKISSKYGRTPSWGEPFYRYTYASDKNKTFPVIRLFIHNGFIPYDLAKLLKEFVEKPMPFSLACSSDYPAEYAKPTSSRQNIKEEKVKVRLYLSETAALENVQTMLRLIESEKIKVSEKTKIPSMATRKKITGMLSAEDFFEESEFENSDYYEKLEPIQSFGWIMLAQTGGIAKAHGTTLKLNRNAKRCLSLNPHEVIKFIFQKWTKSAGYDEFRRITKIKGQKGKGKKALNAVSRRRPVLMEALADCPVDRWVAMNDFFKFLRISYDDFYVGRDEYLWNLYIVNSNYGSLGYSGNRWALLEGPYIRCVFMEYLAVLGIVDVVYVDPRGALVNYHEHWGADDFDFISLYDGLLYFRLTPLGAYCLGLATEYVSPSVKVEGLLQVLPNFEITSTDKLSAADRIFLDTYTIKTSDRVWLIDEKKLTSLLEKGKSIDKFMEFIKAKAKNELPKTVRQFFKDFKSKSASLKLLDDAKILSCSTKVLASLIANDSKTKPYCMLADGDHLVIPVKSEKKFRAALKKLGYAFPLIGK